MTSGKQRRGWVWLAIIAMAVASAPSVEAASAARRAYGPILGLLAAHSGPLSAAAQPAPGLRARTQNWAARQNAAIVPSLRDSSANAGLFHTMLAVEFVGLVSPLTPVSARAALKQHRPPTAPPSPSQFQRPPPFSC